MKRFDEKRSAVLRAVQIWQILVGLAHNRQTITYKGLADLMGYGGATILGRELAYIMYLCARESLPALTILVVSTQTGLPGPGLEVDGDPHKERESVFGFDWYALIPPTVEEYEHIWETTKNNKWVGKAQPEPE